MACCQGLLQGLVSRWLGLGERAAWLGTWQGVVVVVARSWGSVLSVAELGMVLVFSVTCQWVSKALAALWMALGLSGVCVCYAHMVFQQWCVLVFGGLCLGGCRLPFHICICLGRGFSSGGLTWDRWWHCGHVGCHLWHGRLVV